MSRPVAVLFTVLLLVMSIWCLTATPPPIKLAKKGGYTDVHLYHDIAAATARGEPYHQAAAEMQRAHHYPLKPFVTMRLPTLNWLAVHFGWRGVQRLAFCVLFAAIMAWVIALEDTLHWIERIGVAIALAAGGGSIVDVDILALHEYLSGLFLALALAGVFGWPQRWWLVLLPAAAALAIRELALPFVLLAANFAIYEKRGREFAGWAGLMLAFLVAMALHARAIAPLVHPHDLVSQGWTAAQGFSAFLKAVIFTSVLQPLPLGLALLAAMLPMVGWLALPGRSGLFAVLLLGGYAVMISLFSRPDTFYWGAIVLPTYFIGFPLLPRAFWQLSEAIRRSPPGTPAFAG
ncbi:MAG: hypothetical protein M3N34_06930 [Pseudomonadota bacterium]|nr:hypothetical protein [Pseudomonadota bacterium]